VSQRLFYNNKIKTVAKTLVADSQDAAYPSSNLQTDNYAQPWRTADAAGAHNVVNDFGSAQQIDTVFLGNVNLTSGATVKIQANTADSWGAPAFEETLTVSGLGLNPRHRNLYHELASAQTFRYWRLLITDTSNPDGFYEIGEWWLGERVTLANTQQHEVEHPQRFQRNNIEQITEGFQKYVKTRAQRRTFQLRWANIQPATVSVFRVLEEFTEGNGTPFVFVQITTATPYESFFVRMEGDLTVKFVEPELFDIDIDFEEEAAGITLPVD
jgi:hypothetical protein